jgi:hypothetical protein
MNAARSTIANRFPVMWIAVALALFAVLAYVLIAQGLPGVGDVRMAEDAGAIVYVAAGCYLLGGLLILVHRRWLWTIGLVTNSLVILFFFRMYQNRPAVILSPGGLATKMAQLLLEIALIYLVVSDWQRSRKAGQ